MYKKGNPKIKVFLSGVNSDYSFLKVMIVVTSICYSRRDVQIHLSTVVQSIIEECVSRMRNPSTSGTRDLVKVTSSLISTDETQEIKTPLIYPIYLVGEKNILFQNVQQPFIFISGVLNLETLHTRFSGVPSSESDLCYYKSEIKFLGSALWFLDKWILKACLVGNILLQN